MLKQSLPVSFLLLIAIACNNNNDTQTMADNTNASASRTDASIPISRHFRGVLTGGMKGDSIFFDVSADGKQVENLTFKGYWYCDGKLERQNAAGPEGHFPIVDNKVDSHISEPPNGGATAWRFDLSADIKGNSASGTFRMNINALDCNTGMLHWTATVE
jgi:hypothetical protein